MTEAYSRGGVQTYGRRVAEILSDYAGQRDAELHGVSLLDEEWRPEQHPNPVHYTTFAAASGNRFEFLRMSARSAWSARPRVAVVMNTCIAPPALMLRSARMTGPYLLVLHGIEAWSRVKPAIRAAAAGAYRIVATTRHTAREFGRANGIPEEKFSIIPLAVAESEATPGSPSPVRGELRVLAAGRLALSDSYKGFDMLISAACQARAAGANITLRIVGAGDDRERLEAHAASLPHGECVQFLGGVPDVQLRQELEDCHVFALPSRAEGFGLVYLEAMAIGRACIAGNHGGPPEIIHDGVDGFLVEHGNIEQLMSRLLMLWRQPDLCHEMGERAALTVKRQYLFPRMREAWFKLLDTAFE